MDGLVSDQGLLVTYAILLFGPGLAFDFDVSLTSAPKAGLFALSGLDPGPPLRFKPFDAGAGMLSSADSSIAAVGVDSDSLSCGVNPILTLEVVDEEDVEVFDRDSLRGGCADGNQARTVDGSRRIIFLLGLLGLLGFVISVAFLPAVGIVGNDGVDVDIV